MAANVGFLFFKTQI